MLRRELLVAPQRELPVVPQLARPWAPLLRLVARRLAWLSAVRRRSVVSTKDLGTRPGMLPKVRSTG